MQRVRLVAGLERHIRTEPQDIEPIHPDVIRVLLGARVTLKARPRERVEGEALGAFLTLLGPPPVERSLALAPVETGQMAPIARQPGTTVAVHTPTAPPIDGPRS